MPVKPERQEFKPSGGAEPVLSNKDETEDAPKAKPEPAPIEKSPEVAEAAAPVHKEVPTENALLPDDDDDKKEDDSELNPYERALKDNENQKKRFVDELKKETEERKKLAKEEKEAKEQAEKDHREWLEQVYKDTGEMPPELAELRAAEEAKRQEEEAKKRPEPPTAKTMRERVAEESKKRKDAHMAKMRQADEEEKARK